jgi:hypothetical protein
MSPVAHESRIGIDASLRRSDRHQTRLFEAAVLWARYFSWFSTPTMDHFVARERSLIRHASTTTIDQNEAASAYVEEYDPIGKTSQARQPRMVRGNVQSV